MRWKMPIWMIRANLGRVGLMCAMRKSTAVVDQSDDHMACDDRMDNEWRLMGDEGMNS